ncbi:sigma-70 family RNA polymerase sigma factor [Rhodococcus koreensis]|uniref:RNA polymerase sigma-70 factor, ECF subfamily n=1 Tax=Rhodococcus koreensis TaxID=99653 RepID=A0A1H5B373_9NOCA|nr:sigma-70 family RNA polymerase sigma factor [Rhodococcus koreensis]SED48885.1 RNA polymerase sigma-70 factor, ECF subfamily [Rhodococcus koreensis]
MDAEEVLAHRFEENRTHLSAVAYRMLGSIGEAEDAVQEGWLRLSRAETSEVQNLRGWLTTVVGRVCLDMLRSRKARREDPLEVHVPDPIVREVDGTDPEHEAVLGDSVGLALLVVLDTLAPAERLAFVLHDMFALSFDEIAPIADRTPAATRQLASRARRRVQGSGHAPETDPTRQREVVEAFMTASRGGRVDDLLALLDPDIVLRADRGADGADVVRGSRAVGEQALTFSRFAPFGRLALVNGTPGVVTAPDGKTFSVMAFTVSGGKIVRIDILADPVRLQRLGISPGDV